MGQMEDFLSHPFIQSIAKNPRWTASTSEKVPVNMRRLIDTGKLYGAYKRDGQNPCVTLDEMLSKFPGLTNFCYSLDTLRDHVVVLDVEPACPEDIKQGFLGLPWIYGEKSMSGNGLHLVLPLPDCAKDYPIAMNKVVLKDGSGFYEILMCHYVTFTRNQLTVKPGNLPFAPIFANLAAKAKETKYTDVDVDPENEPDFPKKDYILSALSHLHYKKAPEDFLDNKKGKPDMSRWEFGCCGFFLSKLERLLESAPIKAAGHAYTDTEKAWIVYRCIKRELPERPKHATIHEGMPWLLFISREIVAKREKGSDGKHT